MPDVINYETPQPEVGDGLPQPRLRAAMARNEAAKRRAAQTMARLAAIPRPTPKPVPKPTPAPAPTPAAARKPRTINAPALHQEYRDYIHTTPGEDISFVDYVLLRRDTTPRPATTQPPPGGMLFRSNTGTVVSVGR